MKDLAIVLLAAIAIATILIGGPLLCIWSMNTLFGLGIDYTFKNWAATMFLLLMFQSRSSTKSGGS